LQVESSSVAGQPASKSAMPWFMVVHSQRLPTAQPPALEPWQSSVSSVQLHTNHSPKHYAPNQFKTPIHGMYRKLLTAISRLTQRTNSGVYLSLVVFRLH